MSPGPQPGPGAVPTRGAQGWTRAVGGPSVACRASLGACSSRKWVVDPASWVFTTNWGSFHAGPFIAWDSTLSVGTRILMGCSEPEFWVVLFRGRRPLPVPH